MARTKEVIYKVIPPPLKVEYTSIEQAARKYQTTVAALASLDGTLYKTAGELGVINEDLCKLATPEVLPVIDKIIQIHTGLNPESISTAPSFSSRATSAEETIFHHPIGPNIIAGPSSSTAAGKKPAKLKSKTKSQSSATQSSSAPPPVESDSMAGNNGFSEAQRVEQRNMFSEISQNFGTAQRGPLGPPGPPGPPEIEGPAGINAQGGAGPGRFIPGDVGFFNPHYDGEKRLASYGENPSEWTALLLARFKAPRSVGMGIILKEKYTIQDALRSREPRESRESGTQGVGELNCDPVIHGQVLKLHSVIQSL
ncbi:hypothetical protein MMC12_001181 [Toensbergia leucococca]|nr:hypothetical protein [Toensbergia leucococca]